MAGSVGHVRFNGMYSNMDIDKLVSDLMKAQSLPLDKLQRQKQTTMWRREALQNTNKTLLAFRSTLSDLRLESSFNVKRGVSSQPQVLDVNSITSSTPNASYTIQVDKLAQSATLVGEKVGMKPNEPISAEGSFIVEGSKGSKAITIQSGVSTIDSIIADINAASGETGVRASFNTSSGQVILTSTDSGEASKIVITNDSANPTNNLFETVLKFKDLASTGQDAEYKLNGSVTIKSSSNTIDVNGMNITLKSTGSSSIGVSGDTGKVEERIKDFVKQYNEIVELFNKQANERPNRNYKPLTDNERQAMSENQISMWEKKAKEGLLYNDNTLRNAINELRYALKIPVEGISQPNEPDKINMLSEIGIKPSSDYKQNGKLEIDEKKLKEALNSKLDEVVNLFTKVSSSPTDTAEGRKKYREESGIGERLYSIVNEGMAKVSKIIGAGSSLEAMDGSLIGRELQEIHKQETSWKRRLSDIEERYYKKFTAMEKAMQKLESKSSWFAQQLGMN